MRSLVLVAVLALALASPARAQVPLASADARACADCHVSVYAEWRGSRHAVSSTNALFRASFEHWPNGWCLECHAPRRAQQVAWLGFAAVPGAFYRAALPMPAAGAFADGVDCAACHVAPDGAVLAARAPTPEGLKAHAMREEPALADERACARCHEFPFQKHTPPWPFALGAALAQETVTEWRSSKAAARGVRCQDCHMRDKGRPAHGFPGAHDEALVRALVSVDVVRGADGVLRATVKAPGAAHRVPTGDPFRRMVLSLCEDAACARVVDDIVLRRALRRTGDSWEIDEDRTIPPEREGAPAERTFERRPARLVRAWRLSYRFGDRRFEAGLAPHDVGYTIAHGAVREETPR